MTMVQVYNLLLGSPMMLHSHVEHFQQIFKELNPDLVLLSGSFVGARMSPGYKNVTLPFLSFHPPLGTYAIAGSGEYWSGCSECWMGEIRRFNFTVLSNNIIPITRDNTTLFYLAGLNYKYAGLFYSILGTHSTPYLRHVTSQHKKSDLPLILLSDLGNEEKMMIDLQLSGNELGFLPFPLGHQTSVLNNRIVHRSSGVGHWGVPLFRLFFPADLTHITLHSYNSSILPKTCKVGKNCYFYSK
eukprot:TRINITY_DN13008_c0_g1_i9.p1 TRINITY_DN13008_c0_g1~~TRINITY_DN13008_c0_g1_i9.p1  ORF type:complete len:243 (-),score=36.37 TRINITY_DN13008_c0_g1_i9:91-819(-)